MIPRFFLLQTTQATDISQTIAAQNYSTVTPRPATAEFKNLCFGRWFLSVGVLLTRRRNGKWRGMAATTLALRPAVQ